MLDSRYIVCINDKMNGFAIVGTPDCFCFVAIKMAKATSAFAISILWKSYGVEHEKPLLYAAFREQNCVG